MIIQTEQKRPFYALLIISNLFQTKALYFTFIIGSIVSASNVQENSKVQDSLTTDTKKQSKRGTEENRQSNGNTNAGII